MASVSPRNSANYSASSGTCGCAFHGRVPASRTFCPPRIWRSLYGTRARSLLPSRRSQPARTAVDGTCVVDLPHNFYWVGPMAPPGRPGAAEQTSSSSEPNKKSRGSSRSEKLDLCLTQGAVPGIKAYAVRRVRLRRCHSRAQCLSPPASFAWACMCLPRARRRCMPSRRSKHRKCERYQLR